MPAEDAETKRRFRQMVRTLHPDCGGDPEAFLVAMASWPAADQGSLTIRHEVLFYRRRRGLAALWPTRRASRHLS